MLAQPLSRAACAASHLADAGNSSAVSALAEAVQDATGESVGWAFGPELHRRQSYTGDRAQDAAGALGIRFKVVGLFQAKRDFVLLPRRQLVERGFA